MTAVERVSELTLERTKLIKAAQAAKGQECQDLQAQLTVVNRELKQLTKTGLPWNASRESELGILYRIALASAVLQDDGDNEAELDEAEAELDEALEELDRTMPGWRADAEKL